MKRLWRNFPVGVAAIFLAVAFLAVAAKPVSAEPGFLGMQVQGMSPKIAKALGLKSADGVLVRDVVLGGAADKAGFKRGDLILEFNGKKIDSFATMVKAAQATKPLRK